MPGEQPDPVIALGKGSVGARTGREKRSAASSTETSAMKRARGVLRKGRVLESTCDRCRTQRRKRTRQPLSARSSRRVIQVSATAPTAVRAAIREKLRAHRRSRSMPCSATATRLRPGDRDGAIPEDREGGETRGAGRGSQAQASPRDRARHPRIESRVVESQDLAIGSVRPRHASGGDRVYANRRRRNSPAAREWCAFVAYGSTRYSPSTFSERSERDLASIRR